MLGAPVQLRHRPTLAAGDQWTRGGCHCWASCDLATSAVTPPSPPTTMHCKPVETGAEMPPTSYYYCKKYKRRVEERMCGNFSRRRQTSGDRTLAGFCLAPSDRKTPPWIWWRNCESTLPNIEIGPRGWTTPGPPPPTTRQGVHCNYVLHLRTHTTESHRTSKVQSIIRVAGSNPAIVITKTLDSVDIEIGLNF